MAELSLDPDLFFPHMKQCSDNGSDWSWATGEVDTRHHETGLNILCLGNQLCTYGCSLISDKHRPVKLNGPTMKPLAHDYNNYCSILPR